jgi:cell shape-determining protein MreC
MVACLLLSFFPVQPIRNLHQPLDLVQRPIRAAVEALRDWFGGRGVSNLSRAEAERLRTEVAELRRLAGHLEQERRKLERDLEEVTGLRQTLSDVRIVIAGVLGPVTGRREALRIDRGSLNGGIRVGQWVVAGRRLQSDEASFGREMTGRQYLVGRVAEVRTYGSTVLLATDPAFRAEVRLAKEVAPGQWEPLPTPATLRGRGAGEMEIPEATQNYLAEGAEIVLVPESQQLPSPLTIGRVTAAARVDTTQLHFDLRVVPWGNLDTLSRVYVIDPGE